jgi:hypothetical protein
MRGIVSTLACLVAVLSASAQTNPLVGEWLTTFMDPRGITNYATSVTVQPNGVMIMQMSVSGSGGGGQQTLVYAYQMTGQTSYVARVVDYSPKQMCGVVCLPVQPLVAVGTTSNCQFSLENNVILMVSCDGQQPPTRYTRQ